LARDGFTISISPGTAERKMAAEATVKSLVKRKGSKKKNTNIKREPNYKFTNTFQQSTYQCLTQCL